MTSDSGCKTCPDSTNSDSPSSSDSSSDCQCNAGYYGPHGTGSCTPCGTGKFKTSNGQTSDTCDPCASGKWSSSTGRSSNCDACPSNTDSPGGSAAESDCVAAAGYTFDGTNLIACAAGKYKVSTSNAACTDCAAGKFKSSTEQTSDSCTGCSAGKYKGLTGQASDTCVDCPGNTGITSTASDAEDDCLADAGYTGDGTNVAACAAGKYKATTQSATACTDCPGNTGITSIASDAEDDCLADAGYTGDGTNVAACAAGKYKATTQSATACTDCSTGKYKSSTGQTADYCDNCAAGTYKADTGQDEASDCSACPTGSTSLEGSSSAADCTCVAGYSGASGNAPCAECVSGKYQDTAGQATCKDCVDAVNAVSAVGSSASSACRCAAGYHGNAGVETCKSCPAGYFNAAAGKEDLSGCTFCASHTWSPAASASCTSCPITSFINDARTVCQATIGRPIVLNESVPLFLSKSSMSLLQIVSSNTDVDRFSHKEFYDASVAININGGPCKVTFWSSTIEAVCVFDASSLVAAKATTATLNVVREGTHTTSRAIRVEQQCQPGNYGMVQDSGELICVLCAQGQYNTQTDALGCLPVPAGHQATADRSSFEGCAPGFVSAELKGCVLCQAGKVQPSAKSAECLDCKAGSYSSADRTECFQCGQGSSVSRGRGLVRCALLVRRQTASARGVTPAQLGTIEQLACTRRAASALTRRELSCVIMAGFTSTLAFGITQPNESPTNHYSRSVHLGWLPVRCCAKRHLPNYYSPMFLLWRDRTSSLIVSMAAMAGCVGSVCRDFLKG